MAGQAVDPWSAGFMALDSVAKASGPAGPSSVIATTNFDNSGFVVNVGPGSATSSKTALPSAQQAMQAMAVGAGGLLANPVFIVAIGVGLFLYLKHK